MVLIQNDECLAEGVKGNRLKGCCELPRKCVKKERFVFKPYGVSQQGDRATCVLRFCDRPECGIIWGKFRCPRMPVLFFVFSLKRFLDLIAGKLSLAVC